MKNVVRIRRDKHVMVISIPVSFQQRGGRKQIIAPRGSADWCARIPRPTNSLIKAVVSAYRWRQLVESGKYASAAELSKKEGINESYLCRILRLTLLAPDIVEAILDGRQPSTLELNELLAPLSANWSDQRAELGFS